MLMVGLLVRAGLQVRVEENTIKRSNFSSSSKSKLTEIIALAFNVQSKI